MFRTEKQKKVEKSLVCVQQCSLKFEICVTSRYIDAQNDKTTSHINNSRLEQKKKKRSEPKTNIIKTSEDPLCVDGKFSIKCFSTSLRFSHCLPQYKRPRLESTHYICKHNMGKFDDNHHRPFTSQIPINLIKC